MINRLLIRMDLNGVIVFSGNVYITTSIGHLSPAEEVIEIFSIHVLLDDLTTIYVILCEIDEEMNFVSVFQNHMSL